MLYFGAEAQLVCPAHLSTSVAISGQGYHLRLSLPRIQLGTPFGNIDMPRTIAGRLQLSMLMPWQVYFHNRVSLSFMHSQSPASINFLEIKLPSGS